MINIAIKRYEFNFEIEFNRLSLLKLIIKLKLSKLLYSSFRNS